MGGVVAFATFVTRFFPETPLQHFCAYRNTTKLCTDYKDEYMKKVRFIDFYKCLYHIGGCFAHLVGFMAVMPLVYGPMQDMSELMDNLWVVSEYAKKAIYTTQIIFFIRCEHNYGAISSISSIDFLCSGFFSCYFIYPIIKRNNGKMSFIPFVFKRWLRTFPTTVGAILFMFAVGGVVFGNDDLHSNDLF